MDGAREIAVTVKLVFDINIPESVKTPDNVLAEYLVNKLSVDVSWATIKDRQELNNSTGG
ncbi:MAG: hypothetical protein HQL08_06695 [Nitrospirae bacterium]|nr:hypothetical protein [Nitrospirota bacterium]